MKMSEMKDVLTKSEAVKAALETMKSMRANHDLSDCNRRIHLDNVWNLEVDAIRQDIDMEEVGSSLGEVLYFEVYLTRDGNDEECATISTVDTDEEIKDSIEYILGTRQSWQENAEKGWWD